MADQENKTHERITPSNQGQASTLPPAVDLKPKEEKKKKIVTAAISQKKKTDEEKPMTEVQKAIQAGVDIKALVSEIKDLVKDELREEVKESKDGVVPFSTGVTEQDTERWKSKKEKTREWVWAQPQVRYVVPLESGERKGKAFYSWIRNGYRLNIPKGIPVNLPEPIVKDFEEAQNQTMEAVDNKYNLENVNQKTLEALTE